MRTFSPLTILIPMFLLDLYVYVQLRGLLKPASKGLKSPFFWIYWIVSAGLVAGVLTAFSKYNADPENLSLFKGIMNYNAVFISVFVFKLLFAFFALLGDLFGFITKFWRTTGQPSEKKGVRSITRSDFIKKVGIVASMIPVIGIIHGIGWGRFHFTLHSKRISIPNLPDSFNGFKIVQLSDAHLGSLSGQTDRIREVFEQINDLNPDIIVFTGDMVNNFSHEMSGWVPVWKDLKAIHGKFAVLGNHDYGDYSSWPSENAKKKNFQEIIRQEREMGFDVLLNDNREIRVNGQSIYLLGVENWGTPPFPQHGDLQKAMTGLPDQGVFILLSHDPDHFEHQVMNNTSIGLTLSGHTHGFQFGVEIGNFKMSPVQLKYKRWAGLYQEKDQYLYVNRGLGYLAFPGRVGIWPEITLLELVK